MWIQNCGGGGRISKEDIIVIWYSYRYLLSGRNQTFIIFCKPLPSLYRGNLGKYWYSLFFLYVFLTDTYTSVPWDQFCRLLNINQGMKTRRCFIALIVYDIMTEELILIKQKWIWKYFMLECGLWTVFWFNKNSSWVILVYWSCCDGQ